MYVQKLLKHLQIQYNNILKGLYTKTKCGGRDERFIPGTKDWLISKK